MVASHRNVAYPLSFSTESDFWWSLYHQKLWQKRQRILFYFDLQGLESNVASSE